ncbi:MAG: replication-associated recombination protein A [Maricaulaceae bacterium]
MSDLFQASDLSDGAPRPLADRVRPQKIPDVVGQDHLLAEAAPLGRMLGSGHLTSLILWGPPGVGKTTIARLLAQHSDLEFVQISAVFSGVADLRKVFEAAKSRRAVGQGTLLFVDEIHRFNKSQQDAFLPYVEEGVVTLVGATTENPSFELNGALLSRAQVFVLNALDDTAVGQLLVRAEAEMGRRLPLTDGGRETLINLAGGDGRYSLNLCEIIFGSVSDADDDLGSEAVAALLQKRAPAYDKNGEQHYNLISALHKSIRGSDPDASLYWFTRMLHGGEDPLYIGRRLVRMASEDIGLADPSALSTTMAAVEAYRLLGSPEGELALAQAVTHLAVAPKSIGVYAGYKSALRAAKDTAKLGPPMAIRNAPTKLMKEQGYGEGYIYDPDTPEGFSGQNYFPDEMVSGGRPQFYAPVEKGREKAIKAHLAALADIRARKNKA